MEHCPDSLIPNSPLMVIGEAPGKKEIEVGRPFMGAAGALLRSALTEAGFNPAQTSYANITHTRPRGNDISSIYVTKKEANNYAPELRFQAGAATKYLPRSVAEEIQHLTSTVIPTVRPRLLLLCGNTPVQSILRETGIGRLHGSAYQIEVGGHPTIAFCSYHPAAILRSYPLSLYFRRDLQRAREILESEEVPASHWDFTVPTSPAEALSLIEGMPELVSLDIETTGRRWINCVGVATSHEKAFCIPLLDLARQASWSPVQEAQIMRAFMEAVSKRKVIGQNWNYDREFLAAQYRLDLPVYHDTMLAEGVLNPGMPRDLGTLSSLYCRIHQSWKHELKDSREAEDNRALLYYCMQDCGRTYEIAERQTELLSLLGLSDQFRDEIYNQNRNFTTTLYRGVKVDINEKNRVLAEVNRNIHQVEGFLSKIDLSPLQAKATKTNWWNSPKQVGELLHTVLGLPPYYSRKQRRYVTDNEGLTEIGRKHALAKELCYSILAVRRLRKARDILTKAVGPDGRWRSVLVATGAETFRFASKEPNLAAGLNLQNITKGKTFEWEDAQ